MSNLNPIFKNTDTNYALYYNVLNYFRDLMNLHPSIERVSQGDLFDLDDETFPIYPLGNVFISSLSVDESYTDYTIQLLVADKIKYKANESEGTDNQQDIPFYGTDDVVDIHANTLGVLNDLTNYTGRSVSGFDIITSITYTPFVDRFDNKLAGFTADFTLRVHNDRNRCVIDFFDNPTTTTTTSTTTQAPTTTTTTTTTQTPITNSGLYFTGINDSKNVMCTDIYETDTELYTRGLTTLDDIQVGVEMYYRDLDEPGDPITPIDNVNDRWRRIDTKIDTQGGIIVEIQNGIVVDRDEC
jgi:hypothetical protein